MERTTISEIYSCNPSLFAKENLFYVEIAGKYIDKSNYRIEREYYNSLLLMYIVKGRLFVEVKGITTIVEQGEFVFIDCRTPHCYYSEEAITFEWVHIQGNAVFAYSDLLSKRFGSPTVLKSSSMILQEFKIVMGYLRGENSLDHTLSVAIHVLLATISEKVSIQTRSTEQALAVAEGYLRQNFSQQISIIEVADKVDMSVYYFTRQFHKQFGISPYEYLIMQRISNAKRLLLNSQRSTKQIAQLCGYNNSSTFIAAFKSRVGATPSQFRINVKEHIGI